MSTTEQPGTSPPEAPAVAPPEGADAHQATSASLTQTATSSGNVLLQEHIEAANKAMADMVVTLKTDDKLDFQGNFDSAEEFEKNAHFINIQRGLREFLGSNKTPARLDIKKAWINACVQFIIAEIESYDGSYGAMGESEVALALGALEDPAKTGHSKKNGIGNFETWINGSNLKEDHEKWKAERGTAAQAQTLQGKMDNIKATPAYQRVSTCPRIIKNLEVVQAKITAAGEDAEAKIENFQTIVTQTKDAFERVLVLEARMDPKDKIAPTALLATINDLRTKIGEDNAEEPETLLQQLNTPDFEEQTKAVEALKPFVEDREIPDGKKEEIFAKVRDGTKTPAQAKEELEKAKTTTAAATDEEDTPLIDKAKAFIDGMSEGTLKKTLGGLLAALTTTIIALTKLPWIGDKLRGTAISNEILAEKGDPKAVLAMKIEGKFKKFGLPKRFANVLGGGKTSDVIKAIKEKPEELSTDKAVQAKFAWLGKQLESKGGDSSDKSLFDFMAEHEFAYSESQTAVASATPAAAAVAPGTQPPANPAVASAPANPPAGPNPPPPAPGG